MALFDPERKRIVIRVVYDGPGHAGKTTNLQRLCKSFASWRRSELVSPNTLGERTQYFDWLEVDGGLMHGHPVRAQLLTVPGQTELRLRRQFVIERADVVVFVADSQVAGIAEARHFYAELCEQLGRFEVPVPIVFQANKQDMAGALRPDELARRVCEGLRKPAQVSGSVASTDRGVKQTLTTALRLASELLRERWSGADVQRQIGEVGDAATVYAALEHREAQLARGRPALLLPTLPSPELPSTQVWPPVSGRNVIAQVYGRELRRRSDAAHPERMVFEVGFEVASEAGDWRIMGGSDRQFEDLEAAKQALSYLCRRMVTLGSWLIEPCALAVASDPAGQAAWLWSIQPLLPTLADALADPDVEQRRAALLRFAEVALGAEALAERSNVLVELDPGNFAVQHDDRARTRYVGYSVEAGETIDIVGPLLSVVQRFADDEIALADLAEVLCLGLYQVPTDPERRAALRRAFAQADVRAVGPRRVLDAAVMVLARAAAGSASRGASHESDLE
jgi:signal recognition particle receptor subunit beta